MRMTRQIAIQLLIFSLLAATALGIMVFGYMRLPALLGIGLHDGARAACNLIRRLQARV